MTKTFKIGIFDDEAKFISSIKSLEEQKQQIFDVFTPYPVHEVFHLLKRKSKLPTAAYFFGLFAIIGTLGFLYYHFGHQLAFELRRQAIQLISLIHCRYNRCNNTHSHTCKPWFVFSQVEALSWTGQYNIST